MKSMKKYYLIISICLIFIKTVFTAADSMILKNVNIIVCKDNLVYKNVALEISNGKIIKIYKNAVSLNTFINKIVIDLENKYLIPGLIESHTHLSGRSEKALEIALKNGITALRDMAGDCTYLKELSQAVKNEEILSPDIYYSALVAGKNFIKNDKRAILSTPTNYKLGEAPGMRAVDNSTDLKKLMKQSKEIGATGLKIYSHLSKDLIRKITKEAHKQDLKVWAHGIVPPTSLEEVVSSGVNTISHVSFFLFPAKWSLAKHGTRIIDTLQVSKKRLQRIFALMKESKTVFDPTITLQFRLDKMNIKDQERLKLKKNHLLRVLREAYQAKIKIVCGTDIFLPTRKTSIPELHEEIKILNKDVGMTAYDALMCATINGAEVLGIDNEAGTIEEGKKANLVVLNSNPLKNIENSKDIFMVIKNGKIIE